jgi:hypothetical protein
MPSHAEMPSVRCNARWGQQIRLHRDGRGDPTAEGPRPSTLCHTDRMRRRHVASMLAVAAVAGIAGGAVARASRSRAATWADWVGDWDGKLRWSSCTVEGAAAATFAIDATDGAIAIELGGATDALGAMPLIEDNGGWVGQRGDVIVHLVRPRPDAVELAIDLDSGCAIRGTLKRQTIGIAACDRLEAWARIEARCGKLSKPALEHPARLVRQRAEWIKASGAARDRFAAQCDARTAKVEAELIDAGCAPNPDPNIGLRGAECQALRRTALRFGRCANVPDAIRDPIVQDALALVPVAQNADDTTLVVVEAQCREMRARITTASLQSSCPP